MTPGSTAKRPTNSTGKRPAKAATKRPQTKTVARHPAKAVTKRPPAKTAGKRPAKAVTKRPQTKIAAKHPAKAVTKRPAKSTTKVTKRSRDLALRLYVQGAKARVTEEEALEFTKAFKSVVPIYQYQDEYVSMRSGSKKFTHAEAMELCETIPWFNLQPAIADSTKKETLEAARARVYDYGGCRFVGLTHEQTMDAHRLGCDTYALAECYMQGKNYETAVVIAKEAATWGTQTAELPTKYEGRSDDDLLLLAVEASHLFPQGVEVIAALARNWNSSSQDLAAAARAALL